MTIYVANITELRSVLKFRLWVDDELCDIILKAAAEDISNRRPLVFFCGDEPIVIEHIANKPPEGDKDGLARLRHLREMAEREAADATQGKPKKRKEKRVPGGSALHRGANSKGHTVVVPERNIESVSPPRDRQEREGLLF